MYESAFKIGDLVKVGQPRSFRYDCIGVVSDINTGGDLIRVVFSDGISSWYWREHVLPIPIQESKQCLK